MNVGGQRSIIHPKAIALWRTTNGVTRLHAMSMSSVA